MSDRPTVAVHKFSSCDGCQLAFLNAGEGLLALTEHVELVHFAEAGVVAPEAAADITFVEGSVTTYDEVERICAIRDRTRYLITIGACATSGGVQALRNLADAGEWVAAVYAEPAHIQSLATSTPISDHVRVDLELWGCPVNTHQVLAAVQGLLAGAPPHPLHEKVCMECKRRGTVCHLVAGGTPCMGPVTGTGCGALCPAYGRDCYGCYGPAEAANTRALANRFEGLGLVPEAIARRFLAITNNAPAFAAEGQHWRGRDDG